MFTPMPGSIYWAPTEQVWFAEDQLTGDYIFMRLSNRLRTWEWFALKPDISELPDLAGMWAEED